LPISTSFHEVERIVEETIRLLELSHIRGNVIGDEENRGISGGQRKRVNIAMELVASINIILLYNYTIILLYYIIIIIKYTWECDW
jgi:ABC-type multidrug transport system ATPase subunit